MTKKLMKIFFAIIIVSILAFAPALTVSAEVPYESYTYWSEV